MNYWFPYSEKRKYQKQIMDLTYKSLRERKNCIIRAPTGIGKTISILSVALKFAKENQLKVIYLTNKLSGQIQPLKEFVEIKRKFDGDNNLFAGRIISKKDLCLFKDIKDLDAESFYTICKNSKDKECKFYKKFKKDLLKDNKKLCELFSDEEDKFVDIFSLRDNIGDYCPYYTIKKFLELFSDLIVIDYNYILSPFIRQGFFDTFDLSSCIVIFDECHSLPNKCQDLSSVKVSTNIFLACINEIEEYREKYIEERISEKDMEQVEKEIDETIDFLKVFDEVVQDILINRRSDEVPFNLEKLKKMFKEKNRTIDKREIKYTMDMLLLFSNLILEDKKRTRSLSLTNFLGLLLDVQEDERFIQFLEIRKYNGKKFSYLNIHCLDPSYLFKYVLKSSYNVIGFSGTLFLDEFKEIMGFPDDTISENIPSPFSEDQRKVIIFSKNYANFTLKTRNQNIDFKANQMVNMVNNMKGNVLVVFPSTDVFNIYVPKIKDKLEKVVYLRPFADDYIDTDDYRIQRNDILESFKKENNAVLFSIAVGSYNEGVDFIGCLQNVIVVGFPYPGLNYKNKKLEEFFTKKFDNKDYARFLKTL
jgi:DNA excision repair protein ERCC-2